MADKRIDELVAATTVNDDDLLVLQQGAAAKKLSGRTLGDYVYSAAAEKIVEVQQAIADAAEAIDAQETRAAGVVADAQADIDIIAAAVASMAQTGTDTTLSVSGAAADSATVGEFFSEQSEVSGMLGEEIFGSSSSDFPMEFEGGTYESMSVGQTLVKYYSGGYDKTRKVLKSTTFDAPCAVNIKAKTGYVFSIFTSDNGVITGSATLITEYSMVAGQQYGVILRAAADNVDISNVSVENIIDVEYKSSIDELKNALNYANYSQPIILNSNIDINFLVSTTNKWATRSDYSSYMFPKPKNAKSITLTANLEQVTVLSMLKSQVYSNNANVVYATGAKRTVIQSGQTESYVIPDDCKYINLLHLANYGIDYTPSSAFFTCSGIVEPQLTGITEYTGIGNHCIIAASWSTSGGHDFIEGSFSTATDVLVATDYIEIPETKGKMLELPIPFVADTTAPAYGVALYDANGDVIKGRSVAAVPRRVAGDPYIQTIRMYLPENAKYFRTTYWTASARETYDIPPFQYSIIDIPDEYKPITHELPVDTFMQNAIRRARQLTDIKWTPRVNIPRYSMINGSNKHFLDWFYADHEYVGIPYSGAGDDETHWSTIKEWGYTHNWVGQHIPIESFVTAARFPNSIFSETANRDYVSYDSSPFGDVCTALVNYVENGPTPLRGITNFFNTTDNRFRTDNITIANLDMNTLSIGDFLYTQAHVIFISDLMRDKNGNITHIEMSEATTVGNGNDTVLGTKFGGVARRKMWEISEFKSLYGAYIRYRRTNFYGIPYVQSKYVDTGNEGDMETLVDFSCIPYLGEGAIYKVGYIHNSKICIGAAGFTSLIVTKDGEAFGTFDVTGLTEVSVGFSEIGSYEAYLSDGSTQTRPCHWTVVA